MTIFLAAHMRSEHPLLGPVAHRVLVYERMIPEAEKLFGLQGSKFLSQEVDPARVEAAANAAPEMFDNAPLAAELARFAKGETYVVLYTREPLGDGELAFSSQLPGEPSVEAGSETAAAIRKHVWTAMGRNADETTGAFGELDVEIFREGLEKVAWPSDPVFRQLIGELRVLADWCLEREVPIGWRD